MILQEIEALEKEVETATGIEQAAVIVRLLKNYSLINSSEARKHITRLMGLAEELDSNEYRAWSLFYKGNFHRLKGEYPAALECNRQALSLFTSAGNRSGIALTHSIAGNVYYAQTNLTAALDHFFTSLDIRKELDDKPGMAASYNNIGNIYFHQANYTGALTNLYASLRISEELGNINAYPSTKNNIGLVYLEQKNYAEAFTCFSDAIELFRKSGDQNGLANAYSNLANVYIKQEQLAEALNNQNAALALRLQTGDKKGIAASYNNIGNIYREQENYKSALQSFRTGMEVALEIGAQNVVSELNRGMGNTYVALEEYEQAATCLHQALKITEETGEKGFYKESLESLYQLYKSGGNAAKALEYYEQAVAVEKLLGNEETARKIAGLQFDYHLEKKEQELVFERTKKQELQVAYELLGKEKQRSDDLLLNILPGEVADELKEKGSADARHFNNVTVLFTDFKGFTGISEKLTPQQLVDELHICFSAFDLICKTHGIEKIKTIGDSYMCAGGLPVPTTTHAEDIVKAALQMRDTIEQLKVAGACNFEIRIGVHTGPVVAGIVGLKKFAYDIWGDTVNIASRMESSGEAGKVNISQATYELVKAKFSCEYRGEIDAKGKGGVKMYFVK